MTAPLEVTRGLHVEAERSAGAFRLEVALDAAPGETIALVGPNGAGKSTVLAIIAGLAHPERGLVRLDDEVWCDTRQGLDRAPHRRRVGFVQQSFGLFPHLSVRGNIEYGPKARGLAHTEAVRAAGRWIETLGLSQLADRAAAHLSGGQMQRVALARALASGARVLLLDEPFGSLDVSTRAAVRGELRAFLREVALPAVFVTHEAEDALALADRILVLENGAVTQSGTREELLARPRTPFVAELVGLNLYRAELGAGERLREARVGGVVFHVLAHDLEGAALIAFAPSTVTLAAERPVSSAQNTFAGRVTDAVPMTDRLRILVDVGVVLAADISREAAAALDAVPGRTLWASVKATAIEVYP